MQTTNKRRTDAQPAHYPKRNWWHRLIHEIKRRFEQRHAKKDKEPPADKAARITARATRIIALFTIVLAVATSLTLYEIHASGTLDQRAWIGMESVASEPSPPQIGKKGNEWAFVESADRRFFSPEEIKAIKSGGKFLWVYGFISYQDFLDTLHERRFCQRLYIVESGGYAFAEDRSTPQKYTKSY